MYGMLGFKGFTATAVEAYEHVIISLTPETGVRNPYGAPILSIRAYKFQLSQPVTGHDISRVQKQWRR